MFGFVTLVTKDRYVPGAMVLAASLRRVNTKHPIYVIVSSNGLSEHSRGLLANSFDRVIELDVLKSHQTQNLELLGRTDLAETWTKLHVFNPIHFPGIDAIAYLDADTLPQKNIDDIFDYVKDAVFAAAPDVGWPDCFNSGVFVTQPSHLLFDSIMKFLRVHGSFDGGDQGILNAFFSNWSLDRDRQPDAYPTRRLPFSFNVTPSANYTYLPAFNQHRHSIRVLHFIGPSKPWDYTRDSNGLVQTFG